MKSRHLAVACAVLATACAPMQRNKQTQMRIINNLPFDIAVCQAQPTEPLPVAAHPNVLSGALVAAYPHVMECLVGPTSRGPAQQSRILAKVSVSEAGVEHTFTHENLTPEGQACVEKVVKAWVPAQPLPAGAQPVSGEMEYTHDSERGMAVVLGENVPSDYAGAVRLGQPQWCECYAPYAGKVPPTLKAMAKANKLKPTPFEVKFEPSATPEGDALAACLEQKMLALPLPTESGVTQVPRTLVHFNSLATDVTSNLLPELQVLQMQLLRNQRVATSAIASGAYVHAANVYDAALEARFQKQPKEKDKKKEKERELRLREDVVTKCARLVEVGTRWVATLKTQLETDQQTLALAQSLKGAQPTQSNWAEMETALQQAMARLQEDMNNAQQRLESDQKSCQNIE